MTRRTTGHKVSRQVKAPPSVRILGTRWFDLGSDVDWQSYGGMWGRPAPTEEEPDRWLVIRYDPGDERSLRGDRGMPQSALALEVPWSHVEPSDLRSSGLSLDRLDEYGDRIPDLQWEMACVRAYVQTWGGSGRFGGDSFEGRDCRSRACRFLLDLAPLEPID